MITAADTTIRLCLGALMGTISTRARAGAIVPLVGGAERLSIRHSVCPPVTRGLATFGATFITLGDLPRLLFGVDTLQQNSR